MPIPAPMAGSFPSIMMVPMSNPDDIRWYEFSRFRLDAHALVLFRGGRVVRLPRKAVETLVALARRPGEVLLKDELPEGASLSRNVSALRKALSASRPLIETIPRRGYRFRGKVRSIAAEAPDRSRRQSDSRPSTVDAVDVVLGWCSACDRHVWIASPKEAAAALGTTLRAVYRGLESGGVHFRETTSGDIAVCMPSMIENMTAIPRSDR